MDASSTPTRRARPRTTWLALVLMTGAPFGQAGDGAIVPGPGAGALAPSAADAADDDATAPLAAARGAVVEDDVTAAAAEGVTPVSPSEALDPDDPRPFVEPVPGSTVGLELVPVSLGDGDDARVLWFGRTEVTWDAFDAYVFRLDELAAPRDPDVDALSRPSNPFALADRGYGHAGYPAISVSHASAAGFAAWLAAHTGRAYRLPSEDEWRLACEADGAPADRRALDARAWTVRNAEGSTQPVGRLSAGAASLHALLGNAAEWCDVESGRPVLMGGSYESRPDAVGCAARAEDDPAWNATDPQIPKSPWWLADGPFAGFRVVCEAPGDG